MFQCSKQDVIQSSDQKMEKQKKKIVQSGYLISKRKLRIVSLSLSLSLSLFNCYPNAPKYGREVSHYVATTDLQEPHTREEKKPHLR